MTLDKTVNQARHGERSGGPVQVWHHHSDGPAVRAAVVDRCVATIGVFDGVHRGHQRIVARTLARAAELRLPAVAVTFEPLPETVLQPDFAPPLLTTFDRRLQLLAGLGIDGVYVVHFDAAFAQLSPAEFTSSVLVDALRAVDILVGENFRFGRRASGDVGTLSKLGSSAGFMVDVISLAHPNGVDAPQFSSTWIRERIAVGDVEAASSALGRPHRVEGVVVHGDHRGRELGYPTANLDVPAELATPLDGVYAGWLDGMPAAVSIGANPTFHGTVRQVEAHVLDRDDLDLYGEYMSLDLVARLRGMVAFDGVEPLREQMAIDVEQARAKLAD